VIAEWQLFVTMAPPYDGADRLPKLSMIIESIVRDTNINWTQAESQAASQSKASGDLGNGVPADIPKNVIQLFPLSAQQADERAKSDPSINSEAWGKPSGF